MKTLRILRAVPVNAEPNPPDLGKLRELLAEGTPGPWHVQCWMENETDVTDEERREHFAHHDCCSIMDDAYYSGRGGIHIYDEGGHDNADAELICGAVNALPALLDYTEALVAAIHEWCEAFRSGSMANVTITNPHEAEGTAERIDIDWAEPLSSAIARLVALDAAAPAVVSPVQQSPE